MYYVYLLRCKDGSLYCGITNNLEKRIKAHNIGKGSKYVRSKGGGICVYTEEFLSKSTAIKREYAIKQLSKLNKELLVKTNPFTLSDEC